MSQLHGDLARAVCHEPSDEWPEFIEIVAYWAHHRGKRGKKKRITISADEFFGRNGHGAPMTGEQLLNKIERLRRG